MISATRGKWLLPASTRIARPLLSNGSAIDFEVFLAPTVPARVAMLSWEELSAEERSLDGTTAPGALAAHHGHCTG